MIGRTPNTFVVGAGPVATALAGALRLGGVPVLGLYARRPEAARSAGAVAGVAAYSTAPPDLLLESQVIVVAVSDDAIGEVAQTLLATGLVTRSHVMLHCSGVMSAAEAFGDVSDRLGGIGTMHPLRAIPDGAAAMRDIAGTVFGVEGDDNGRRAALDLIRALKGRSLVLEGEQMAAYHAAAAIASNYLVGLIDAASELLVSVGIDHEQALAALVPLAQGALDNVSDRGVVNGLTGPIRRGDVDTVERHLRALSPASPQLALLYRQLGLRIVEVARRSEDVDTTKLDAVESLLSSEAPPAHVVGAKD